MRRLTARSPTRWLAMGFFVSLALWITVIGLTPRASNQNQIVANSPLIKPEFQVPPAVGTSEATLAPETPTRAVPTATPTPVTLQPATVITPSISSLALDANLNLSENTAVNNSEPLHSEAFAPTGDKLLYMTISGGLYWSNLDGTNGTLIESYDPAANYNLLDDQMPKGNALLVPGYATQFASGKTPVISAAPDTIGISQIRWWSATRASGIGGIIGGYIGGEQLVTLDATGQQVSSVNIPYIESGAVQPGGTWLAYATSQQPTNVQFI